MRRRSGRLLLSLVAVLLSGGVAWADQDYIGASGGNYNVGTNWSAGSVPTDEAAFIRNGATVTLDAAAPNVTTLWLGGPEGDPSASGTLHALSGGLLTTTGSLVVGNVYNGTVYHSGGNISTPALYMSSSGTTGQSYYGLSGGTLTVDYTLPGGGTTSAICFGYYGGEGGTAKFVQTGGYVRLQNYYNINVGGGPSMGEFTMTNGSINQVGDKQFNVGIDSGADNKFTMTAGTVEIPYKTNVGYGGRGTFNQNGGVVNLATSTNGNAVLAVGICHGTFGSPTDAVYNLNAGMLNVYNRLRIGDGWDATLGQAHGVMNVNGGTLLHQLGTTGAKRMELGNASGRGTLNVTAGSVNAYYDIVLASGCTGPIPEGVLTVSGSGVVTTTKVHGGRAGTAKIEVSGGSLGISSLLRVGGGLDGDTTDPNCVGQMTVSGGSVTVGGNLSVGYKHGTGTVTLSNGVFQVGGRTDISDVINAGLWPTGSGTFIMTGGRFESGFGPLGTGMDPVRVGVNSSSFMGAVAKGALIITGGTFRAPEIRLLNDCDPLSPDSAKLKIGANADVELSNQLRIYKTGSAVEMEIVSATKNSLLKSLGAVDLGTNKGILAVNSTDYRPREGDKFTLMTAPTSMTGSFSSISSNITLGLPGSVAFTGGIVTDPNTSALSYVVTFQGLTAGDADGNHRVDGGDLALMGGGWMKTGQTWGTGDFDGNGKVDGSDLALMGGNWMWTKPASAPEAAVPEPATLALLGVGVLAVIRRKR